ncbi:MAG: hypothetical protein R2746_06840 [Acidimicrobiales bacterium]
MANPKIVGAAALTAALAAGGVVGAALGSPATSGASTNAATTTVPASGSSGSATPAPPADGDHGPGRGFGGGAELDAAAKALGISADDLRTALRDGKSIADVAKEKGVDKQKVIDAMVAAAEARLDEAKAALPDRIAAMVDGKMPAGGPRGEGGPGGHGPGGRRGPGLDAAAKALGMTTDELHTALEGDKTIADVAKEKGVDLQKVIDAMVADAKTHLAEAVEAGRLTQAQADERMKDLESHITDLVNGKAPAGRGFGPGGDGAGGGLPGRGGN